MCQSPDQLSQIEQEAIRLSEEIKAEYWAVSAKSGGNQTHVNMNKPAYISVFILPMSKLSSLLCLFIDPGDGVKDFFFRVASLTFEANVLSELEKNGSRHVGDVISESLCLIVKKAASYLTISSNVSSHDNSQGLGWISVVL